MLGSKIALGALWGAAVVMSQYVFEIHQEMSPHYSEIAHNDRPVDLQQYQQEIVIRADTTDKNVQNFLLLNKHQKRPKDSLEETIDYKVWTMSKTQNFADIQIDEANLVKLQQAFPNMEYKVIMDDMAQTVYELYPEGWISELGAREMYVEKITSEIVEATKANVFSELFFKDYRPLESINAWLDLIEQLFPDLIKIETIGETYEHRSYRVVHMLANTGGGDHSDKKTIVITGGVHAREWISISLVCYAIFGFLQYYQENPDRRDVLEDLDFLFIPVANPDGYEYTWNTDRLWRKNRQETNFPRCFGIDIDHSYDYHWTRSSDWACGEEYSGEVPFEAIESQIWSEYLNSTNHNHEIKGYIDLHSYSQEVLYPYAYSCEDEPRDLENLIELGYGIAKAIRLQLGKNYQVLPACVDKDLDLLPDLGLGSALDYMYHNKAFWAYQLKLRDSGAHGFLLPGKYVEPVGKEILAGLRYFCEFILQEY